ncbi:hypothetical protein PanWU01x14_176160 [Parasponia andersonii]|uniref:Uncharacterized protein n=1 Tax=Parasponia andersonii TaxID=3476 RepID=A0A2P5C820_PARAD|nr:hypothetical protein PanWU01x14_176160 [Parasponia andersonii]
MFGCFAMAANGDDNNDEHKLWLPKDESFEGKQSQAEGLQENETNGNDETENSTTPEINFSLTYIT